MVLGHAVVVGVTGRVGSGKSWVASIVQSHFVCACIDLDLVGHEALVDPGIYPLIIAEFGHHILDGSGRISRSRLGEHVFSDSCRLDRLNAIVHPWIRQFVLAQLQTIQSHCMVVGALIDEIGLRSACNHTVVVDAADADIRSHIGEKFDRISIYQRSRQGYLQSADVVISNLFSSDVDESVLTVFRRLFSA